MVDMVRIRGLLFSQSVKHEGSLEFLFHGVLYHGVAYPRMLILFRSPDGTALNPGSTTHFSTCETRECSSLILLMAPSRTSLTMSPAGRSCLTSPTPVPLQYVSHFASQARNRSTHAHVTIRDLSPACSASLYFFKLSSNETPPAWSMYAWVTTALPSYMPGQIAVVPRMASWNVDLRVLADGSYRLEEPVRT